MDESTQGNGRVMFGRTRTDVRLAEHVDRLAQEHPPIELASVDYTVRQPIALRQRYGHVLAYMARVELEVERNVRELTALLPHPPEIDRRFYSEVWQPQEIRHGVILDGLQVRLGWVPAEPDLGPVSPKIEVLGALSHLQAVQDVSRMLYYLTGMATERSAVLAYNLLFEGVEELGETAVAQTVIAPIRRQEPGHYAFYQLSARGLWPQLAGWQRWLVRLMRTASFAPVGANNGSQRAEFGRVMTALGIDRDIDGFAAQVSRAERDLLWANRRGLSVPSYIARAFHDAAASAEDNGRR